MPSFQHTSDFAPRRRRVNGSEFIPLGWPQSRRAFGLGVVLSAEDPNAAVNIAAMSDEEARTVIQQICSLSQATAYVLGKQSNSA
jgi:hypothetical protein